MNRPNTRRGFGPFPVKWFVQIKDGATVVHQFEAMGYSRTDVQRQHEGMCADGQQCIVLDEDEYLARCDRIYEAARDSGLLSQRYDDSALADQMDAAGREAWRHA